MKRITTLAIRVGLLAAVGLVVLAGPAAADPPRPGDYTSEITRIEPDVGGFDISVFGGDSFLRLRVDPGVEVIVKGYEKEPYLRFADGIVERNLNSPASYLNDDRYGRVDIPKTLVGVIVADLEPNWEQVATGTGYAWHDHRVHWMAPEAPPAVSRGGDFAWNGPVDLTVDGTPVSVFGRIEYHRDISPVPWFALTAVAALVVTGAAIGLPGRGWSLLGAAIGLAAIWVSWGNLSGAPDGSGVSSIPIGIAFAAVLGGVLGAFGPRSVRPVAMLVSAVMAATWGGFRIAVLTNPVLPTKVPFWLDRGVTAVALGAGVGLAIAAFRLVTAFLALQDPPVEAATTGVAEA